MTVREALEACLEWTGSRDGSAEMDALCLENIAAVAARGLGLEGGKDAYKDDGGK